MLREGEMIVAFCGHANYVEREGDAATVLLLLEDLVGDLFVEFFLGEYGSFDSFAYRCARCFKEKHTNARLVFVTPYLSENYRKNDPVYIKERFDQTVYPPIEGVPPRYAILRRNKWIAEKADVLVAYITHEYGGAYTMYRQAVRAGKKIYNIAEERKNAP